MRISRQASLKIKFIVVGGGLSGLSTAYVLATAGHSVRVLEKLAQSERWTGGVQVPPNLTKLLFQWGMEEELQRKCCTVLRTCLADLDTGETIGYLPWGKEVQAESGAPFYTMQHCELHDMLRRHALSAGVEIIPDTHVASISPALSNADTGVESRENSSRPSVTLSNGEKLYADVIVGADGPFSVVRQCVEEEPTVPHWDGHIHFSGVIPMESLKEEKDLNKENIAMGYMWCEAHNAVLGFPVSNAKEYAVHLWYQSTIPDADEGWLATLSPEHFKHQFAHVEKRLVKLMDKLSSVSWVRRLEWPKIEDWVDHSGYIVLVGDAARPASSGATHAAAAAVEGAVVLGTVFSHLRSYDEISTLLYAYQELRQPRVQVLETLEDITVAFRSLPPGPARDAKNEHIKQTNFHAWTYNAFDVADDWWTGWSALKEHSLQGDEENRGVGMGMEIPFEIAVKRGGFE